MLHQLEQTSFLESWNWLGSLCTAFMTDHFNTLRRRAAKGQATLLDHYGATDPGEFFAVATECFFEKPRQMGRKYPDLYDLLCDFYRQDPAERVASKEP